MKYIFEMKEIKNCRECPFSTVGNSGPITGHGTSQIKDITKDYWFCRFPTIDGPKCQHIEYPNVHHEKLALCPLQELE